MDTTSKFQPESHVAQQSRRDKLRVHHFEDLNPDLVQVRNVRNGNFLFDPTLVSPGIVANTNVLPPQMTTNASSNVSGDPQSCSNLNPIFVGGELHFVSSSPYPNGLQDIVTTASVGTQIAHQASTWTNRPVLEHCQQWSGELGFLAAGKSNEEPRAGANDGNTNTTQGLCLTLSSNPTSRICDAAQFTEEVQDSKGLKKPGHLYCMPKPSIISKGSGNSTYSSPLGPFTGYATILKNSRFVKPAQELLDQYCHMTNSKLVGQVCETPEGISGDAGDSALADVTDAVGMEDGAIKGNNSGASFSSFRSSSGSRVDVGVGSSSGESFRPSFQQKKAHLLYLQEEVCRRYKLYYQQIQMVISSFESIAGLRAATPYVSVALKTVERNFRCLRNAISDRVRHISRALGEDFSSTATGSNSSKGDIIMSKLKRGFSKYGGVNVGFLEPQQQGWRPQRGLPERAVTILRAWLFEHFLHPYPTDVDKHMLATQTGLSRNQVSNWFINARVRVWKPMVEEIHMLESKGSADGNQNLNKSDVNSTSERGTLRPNAGDQSINRSCINITSDRQLACADMAVAGIMGDANDSECWYHDKRPRMDFRIPTSIEEGQLISFAPYEQSGLEMRGLGAVSLTLGLRHGVESAQGQQQQQQQQNQHQQQYQSREDQFRRQFGGQMIHDFVG